MPEYCFRHLVEKENQDTQWISSIDGSKYPALTAHILGQVITTISDPEMVRELMTSKNLAWDKDWKITYAFGSLLSQSFLFSPADSHWKKMKKASSHAFYRDRLRIMIESIKTLVSTQSLQWLE